MSRQVAGQPSLAPLSRAGRVVRSAGRALIPALVGLALGLLVAQPTEPPADPAPVCPTEDSCQPVYTDGRWVVVPIVP